jgi:hypothetical protein
MENSALKELKKMVKNQILKVLGCINLSWAIIVFVICSNSYGAYHYVDKTAGGLNNGTSWDNAWERFTDINWAVINPGDTIYISGGSTSKKYNEKFILAASGTKAKPITITKGEDTNHDGIVIIDGNGKRNCIVIEKQRYVNLSQIQCQNGGQDSGKGTIHIDHAGYIKIEYCDFPEINTHGAIFIERSDNCLIGNNRITSVRYTNIQTDGIYSQHNKNNIYENNNITIFNQHPVPHCDGIQSYNDTNAIIRGNYLEQNNSKKGNAQGIYATSGAGTFLYYNNVVFCPNTKAGLLSFHSEDFGAKIKVYNNTATGRSSNLIVISGSDSIVKNNILNGTEYGPVFYIEDSLTNISEQIDYNIYNNSGGELVYYVNGYIGWNQWRNFGAEVHGLKQNPEIDSNHRPSSNSSPAVDNGTSLSKLFTIDKDGVSRPHGAAWDIGAFEYTGTNM